MPQSTAGSWTSCLWTSPADCWRWTATVPNWCNVCRCAALEPLGLAARLVAWSANGFIRCPPFAVHGVHSPPRVCSWDPQHCAGRSLFMQVPEEWSPPEPGLLVGEALEELPEGAVQGELSLRLLSTQVWAPTSGHATETLFRCMQGKLLPPSIRLPPPAVRAGSEPTVVPFAARDLPLEPAARFAALFARQPRWQRRVRGPAALLVLQGPLATVLLGCRRGAQRSAAPLPTQY